MSEGENVEASAAPEPAPESKPESKDERTWAMLCHLSGLAAFLGIPFANILAPLIIWLLKKEEFALVDQEGKKALNFQITMGICGLIAFFLCFVFVGFLLLPVVMIVWLIFTIIAAVKTSNGQTYEYPFSFKFIS